MKLLSKEIYHFDDDEYTIRLRSMNPDALYKRACLKVRAVVSNGAGVVVTSILVVPTHGAALPGLLINGRTLDIARRKRKLIEVEIQRRNLPVYRRRKRDVIIPLSIVTAVWSTVGAIDVIGLTNTSGAVAADASGGKTDAIKSAFQHPADFFKGAKEGIVMFHEQAFMASPDAAHVTTERLGDVLGGQSAPGGSSSTAAGLHGTFAPHGSGHVAREAAMSQTWQQTLAAHHPGGHHAAVLDHNAVISQAATTGGYQAPAALAGLSTGFAVGSVLDKLAASLMIEHMGIIGIKHGYQIEAGPPGDHHDNASGGQNQKDTDSQLQKDLYADILRGETRLQFAFLSPKGQRITQAITASAHGKTACRHDVALAQPRAVVCHFCEEVVMTKTYYHCCQCLDSPASPCGMNICEVCVAGRGCSCTPDRDHILFRKGWLTDTVAFGQLVGLGKPNGSKKWWRRKPAQSPEVGSSDQITLYESDEDEDDDDDVVKSASAKKTVFMGFRGVQRQ